MNPEEFSRAVEKKATELKNYATNRFPTKAGNIALRFINENFRAKGFQGSTFKRWKANSRNGTILIKTGKLRAATFFTTQHGQVTIKNQMPYAKLHNEGFKGSVVVKAHTRNKYVKTKVGTGKFTKKGKERTKTMTIKTGQSVVSAHTRKIDITQRQFIPTTTSPSPVLDNAILCEVARDINQIMQ